VRLVDSVSISHLNATTNEKTKIMKLRGYARNIVQYHSALASFVKLEPDGPDQRVLGNELQVKFSLAGAEEVTETWTVHGLNTKTRSNCDCAKSTNLLP
jgi:hypothetical protein